jgi:hypothetical protein
MSTLTILQLKQFKGFENISDQEGEQIINSLFQFSVLAYRFFHCKHLPTL